MPLPTFLVIGAMKCGTSALHTHLGAHPDVAVTVPKELNFFIGPAVDQGGGWTAGNWHRGLDWYAGHFTDRPARGEASPGYTSPAHAADAAVRIATVLPAVTLLCCVRDPLERAVSQYRHHAAEGTERRSVDEALLDPASQYMSRSRYAERLAPYLARFPRERLQLLLAEDLATRPRETLARCFAALDVDPAFWSEDLERRVHTARAPRPEVDARLRAAFAEAVADDVAALRALLDDPLDAWSI